tara:strand:+ start:588 stop:980 length:393 start_codon:yes stop_codon:yes gene_type:complete
MPVIRDAQSSDSYTDRLGKILPSELTATYFLLRTLAGTEAELTIYLVALALVLAVTFYFIAPRLIRMVTPRNRVLYCVTFLFWALAIDPERIALDVIGPPINQVGILVFLASGLAAIWSFAVPFLMDEAA